MRLHRSPTAFALAALLPLAAITGCGSDSAENDDVPADDGTVVPQNDIGVGGGAPVDNLDEGVNDGSLGNPDTDVDNNQPSQQEG